MSALRAVSEMLVDLGAIQLVHLFDEIVEQVVSLSASTHTIIPDHELGCLKPSTPPYLVYTTWFI